MRSPSYSDSILFTREAMNPSTGPGAPFGARYCAGSNTG